MQRGDQVQLTAESLDFLARFDKWRPVCDYNQITVGCARLPESVDFYIMSGFALQAGHSLGPKDQASIVALAIAAFPDIQGIYVYGSMARGEGRSDSDVDIALVRMAALEAGSVFQLRAELGAQLGRDIDIVDLRRASTEMAFQIVTDGLCLFGATNESLAIYENSIMAMYANLQVERRGILEDIVTRGSVYGR